MTLRRTLPVALVALAVLAACASSDSSSKRSTGTAAKTTTTVFRPKTDSFPAPLRSTAGAEPVAERIEKSVSGAPAGTMRMHYAFGPITIEPGQNNITFSKGKVPKPKMDGWITRIAPNLVRKDGKAPPVDVIHLHHGVWLNLAHKDLTAPGLPERFVAAGEEKTVFQTPSGFGYAYKASDNWLINYMLHNLTDKRDKVWITYDIDFLPATAPAAKSIKPSRPVWLDVQNGSTYPVFDALKGSGKNGHFTYPDDAADPYHGKAPKNVWTADRAGVLIGGGGHLHPGGLWDDIKLTRAGASATPGSKAAAVANGDTVRLFRSEAKYYEPAGAVSWDVSMTVTPQDWRVAVKPGDKLSISTTYDTRNASWYESMGIAMLWMADGSAGADPFKQRVDAPGEVTHGHLPENDHHGGQKVELADLTTRTDSPAPGKIDIIDFIYARGDMTSPTGAAIPSVHRGGSLTFTNKDAPIGPGIWHTITACKAPCNKETGIAYPLADNDVQFDSGELGNAGPPTSGTVEWKTPASLPTGTYTYFCRVHPYMRGAFRVKA